MVINPEEFFHLWNVLMYLFCQFSLLHEGKKNSSLKKFILQVYFQKVYWQVVTDREDYD